jgi:4-amino-4-deoxy-L-arabinose transferase-like glycosyltransferase
MMLALSVLVGVSLRFFMAASAKPFWGDEWFTVELVQKSLAEVVNGAVQDVHPPLYFVLLHGVMRILGTGEWVFRSVSFVAGVALVPAVYGMTRELFSKKEAALASFLTAVSPYWLQSSNEVRSYGLFSFLAGMTVFSFLKASREPARKSWKFLYGIFLISSIYTEHYGWFLWLGATGAAVTGVFRAHRRGFLGLQAGLFLAGLPSLGLIALQAFFSENMFHAYRLREYQDFFILLKKLAGLFWHFACGYTYSMLDGARIFHYLKHSPFFWVSAFVGVFASALALGALAGLYRPSREKFIFCFFVLPFPVILLAFFYPIRLDARYLSFAAPVYYALLAGGFCRIKKKRLAASLAGLYLWVAGTGTAQAIFSPTDPVHKENYLEQVLYVFSRAKEGDAVCGSLPQIAYYRARRLIDPKVPLFARWDDLLGSNLSGFNRVWLLDGLNMNSRTAEEDFKRIRGYAARIGFSPTGDAVRFGGEEGLTVVYLLERKK